MSGSSSKGRLTSKAIVFLLLVLCAGCAAIPPAAAPAAGTSPEPPAAQPPREPGAGDAAVAPSLLPAWRDTENILILGADRDVSSGSWRTDALMVLGLDRPGRAAALLSVPRDLYVDIPGHGGGRINTVDALGERAAAGGGPALVSQVLAQTLGLRIDHWIRVDIDDLRQFIDRLGGIDVHLDCPFYEPILNLDAGRWEYLTLPAGDVHMDGETAYWFVRLRLLEGDAGRAARQRQLLLALRAQVLSARGLQGLPGLIDEFGALWATDMTLAELFDAARRGLAVPPADIHAGRLGSDGMQLFRTPNGAEVLRIVDAAAVRRAADALWRSPAAPARRDGQAIRCTAPAPELLETLNRAAAAGALNR